MAYRIERTDAFEAAYDRTIDYLCNVLHTSSAAKDLMAEVDDIASVLNRAPYIRAVSKKPFLQKHDLREYFFMNYVIVYKIADDTVMLMNFFHQTQDYGAARYWEC